MDSVYVFFDIINYKGLSDNTGLALPICGFKFKPQFTGTQGVISNTKILWDFGDGTTSTELEPIHVYLTPGTYNVTSYHYGPTGNIIQNSYARPVIVSNYITDSIIINLPPVADDVPSYYELTACFIASPLPIKVSTSWQSFTPDTLYTVVPYASASSAVLPPNYFNIPNTQYKHLERFHSFYKAVVNPSGNTEYIEISSFNVPQTLIYGKLSANQIVETGDVNDTFLGTRGTEQIYFRTDAEGIVPLYFGFADGVFDTSNTSTVGIRANINPIPFDFPLSSYVTSNGIDGEYFVDTSFEIDHIKYVDTPINFVARIKGSQHETIASFLTIDKVFLYDSYNNTLLPGGDNLTPIEYGTIEITSVGPTYTRGVITPNMTALQMLSSSPTKKLRIFASSFDPREGMKLPAIIPRLSTEFTLLSSAPKIAKINEDVDMTQNYKDLIFQETLIDQKELFDTFLGGIVGDINSEQDSIGKKIYEKIANFVGNNSDIYKCNLPQLVALLQEVGDNNITFQRSNFSFPSSLSRLIDLLSVKHSYLFGAQNTFDSDFRPLGFSNEFIGRNLGPVIDTLSYTVSAGIDIVYREKYSNTYKKVDTFTPLSAYSLAATLSTGQITYPLSSYASDWGWNLILNDSYVPSDIPKFYEFYNFIPTASTAANVSDSLINFTDINNTLAFTSSAYTTNNGGGWIDDAGIVDNIISYQLYKGLKLL